MIDSYVYIIILISNFRISHFFYFITLQFINIIDINIIDNINKI